jgi:[ribosomal protein S18]-alanine N-acetyltransferase
MHSDHLKFRPMLVSDVATVIQVENNAYDFPWSEGIFQDCLRVGYECWLAIVDNSITGHAIISIAADESHILNITIAKQFQNRGYGKKFIEFLITIAANKKVNTLLLEVRPSNKSAISCYNATGFNEIGCRKNYYPATEGREDALLYALDISHRYNSEIV